MTDKLKPCPYPDGFGIGSALYGRDKFRNNAGPVEMIVSGETSRSWIVCRRGSERFKHLQTKIPKAKRATDYWYSLAEYEESCWLSRNAYRIADAVRSVRDPALLRRIAALVDYTEPTVEKKR